MPVGRMVYRLELPPVMYEEYMSEQKQLTVQITKTINGQQLTLEGEQQIHSFLSIMIQVLRSRGQAQ